MSSATALPRRALERIWRSRFARNVAVVASGTAAAQAITMAFAPLITRIYGPEAFGLLGTFMAVVAVAIPVAVLVCLITTFLQRNHRDAVGLVGSRHISRWARYPRRQSSEPFVKLFAGSWTAEALVPSLRPGGVGL